MTLQGRARLAHRIKKGVGQCAIPDHVSTTGAQLKIACQADARLLDAVASAGDRDLVRVQPVIVAHEGFLNERGWQRHGAFQVAKHSGTGDLLIGMPRERVVIAR